MKRFTINAFSIGDLVFTGACYAIITACGVVIGIKLVTTWLA